MTQERATIAASDKTGGRAEFGISRRALMVAGTALAVGAGGAARAQAQVSAQTQTQAGSRDSVDGQLFRPTADFSPMPPGPVLPSGWQEQRVRSAEANRFSLVQDEGRTVLRIASRQSASSLLHRLTPPLPASRLAWSWRTDAWPSGLGSFGDKAGDDFSLRLYLMFDYPMAKVPLGQRLLIQMARGIYGADVPAATLCYVADPRVPAETLRVSPYTSRVQVMVVRSEHKPGAWWAQERDLLADFQRAFGAEFGQGVPPVAAVALAADTDQGGGQLDAWFSDLRWSTTR